MFYVRNRLLRVLCLSTLLAAIFVPSASVHAQTGICGRTAEVRDAILAEIPDVSDCALVTSDHLAAITGTLNLNGKGITALAAGDFAGLTSLTQLDMYSNKLPTLPAGVFDDLTSLTELYLNDIRLTGLPAGLFDDLTSLTLLRLNHNWLTGLPAGLFDNLTSLTFLSLGLNDLTLTGLPSGVFDNLTALTTLSLGINRDLAGLPSGVFDNLTSLTELYLHEDGLIVLPSRVFEPLTSLSYLNLYANPGAPFAPVAVALPDDGTVPVAGGTVTLDGSEDGPWGANVTYSWALTNPSSGVTVTFDDAASATPVVTIPALAAGTELTFTLTVTGRGTLKYLSGTATGADTATVTVSATGANAAPSFTSPASFDAAENQTAVGTVQASDGDSDDSVTGYAIEGGVDRLKFTIAAATGVLTFASAPNFENPADADGNNAYEVVVRATSGAGARVKTADQTIMVTVTDVEGEAPGVPATPTVASASASSVTASWTAPANAGPAITDYDYRHRVKSPQGSWTEVTNTPITALGATIAQLAENTEYEVQVRATNAEGTGGWSESGSGSTDANAPDANAPEVSELPLSLEESELPESVRLGQNYPNPFNPSTTIEYALPRLSKVHLAVYDLLGHHVAVLTDGVRQAGAHAVRFDASGLSSGTYVYRLVADKQVLTGHMSLVK